MQSVYVHRSSSPVHYYDSSSSSCTRSPCYARPSIYEGEPVGTLVLCGAVRSCEANFLSVRQPLCRFIWRRSHPARFSRTFLRPGQAFSLKPLKHFPHRLHDSTIPVSRKIAVTSTLSPSNSPHEGPRRGGISSRRGSLSCLFQTLGSVRLQHDPRPADQVLSLQIDEEDVISPKVNVNCLLVTARWVLNRHFAVPTKGHFTG